MDSTLKLILAIVGIGAFAAVFIALITSKNKKYKDSQYYKVTGNTRSDLKDDAGKTGEYRIYETLREYEDKGARFLFNIYIPMEKGGTTELDAVMICKKGIMVFESKSRYGWLQGAETDKYWSQFLFRANGSLIENKLYNPILQNRGHIAHLKKLLGGRFKTWSVIVFSEKTDIARISVTEPDTFLTTESELKRVVGNVYWNAKDALTDTDITSIYFKLYPYTKVTEAQKQKHIKDIKTRYVDKQPIKSQKRKRK